MIIGGEIYSLLDQTGSTASRRSEGPGERQATLQRGRRRPTIITMHNATTARDLEPPHPGQTRQTQDLCLFIPQEGVFALPDPINCVHEPRVGVGFYMFTEGSRGRPVMRSSRPSNLASAMSVAERMPQRPQG